MPKLLIFCSETDCIFNSSNSANKIARKGKLICHKTTVLIGHIDNTRCFSKIHKELASGLVALDSNKQWQLTHDGKRRFGTPDREDILQALNNI